MILTAADKRALSVLVLMILLFVCDRWLLQRGCTGSRNVLDAFRKAVENEEERAHGIGELLLYI